MKKYMILLLIALLAACSSNDVPLPPADAWLPVVSRAEAAADAKEYLVTLKYGSTISSGTLVAGSTSSWKNEVPQWPADNQAVDVLALYPAKDVMPSVLADDAVYLMHYSRTDKNTKPAKLTMHHLMAQSRYRFWFIRKRRTHRRTVKSVCAAREPSATDRMRMEQFLIWMPNPIKRKKVR